MRLSYYFIIRKFIVGYIHFTTIINFLHFLLRFFNSFSFSNSLFTFEVWNLQNETVKIFFIILKPIWILNVVFTHNSFGKTACIERKANHPTMDLGQMCERIILPRPTNGPPEPLLLHYIPLYILRVSLL